MLLTDIDILATDTVTSTPDILSVPATSASQMNILELCLQGGWLMIPLLVLSLISIYVLIERLLVLHKASVQEPSFMHRIRDYILSGDLDSARNLCRTTATPYSRLIEKGISRIGRPMNDVLVAIENTGNIEIANLERGLPLLATTAAGAPMLGFLGTVIGMVKAFYEIASAGSASNISTFADGIYTALVTTVAGLIVGVIALFAYNYLVARINRVMNNLETKTMEFMDLLNEPA